MSTDHHPEAGISAPTGPGDRDVDPFTPPGVPWRPVSPRLAVVRRLLLVGQTGPLAVLLGALGALLDQPWLTWSVLLPVAFTVWSWIVIGRQVRAWGYAEREDDLLVRRGVMWRGLVVVPYGRMQYVDVHAGPLDRLFGIATVQLHTASAATDAQIPGLVPEEAARLRDRLASRGQAQLAGL